MKPSTLPAYRVAVAFLLHALVLPGVALAWFPGTGSTDAVEGFVVDSSSRTDVLAFYHTIYTASESYAQNMGWTGNVTTGVAGTTTSVFKDDVRRRVNFYRALVGLPADIIFNDAKSAKCQQAALMMSANTALSHTPPSSWTFYTADGAEAAGKSNLYLGQHGAGAIDGYIVDPGSGNYLVGHRRWILYSRAREMGTGDIPPTPERNSANALWVIGDAKTSATPKFVAWPNSGFIPQNLVPARWSLSYPNANFGSATVTMTRNETPVSLVVVSRTNNGYGDNTIVWEPTGLPSPGLQDAVYSITVSNISGTGLPTSYSYSVTTFNTGVLGDSVVISGPSTSLTSGATFSFNPIAQADRYELRISKASTADWLEGAENLSSITDRSASSYSLAQTTVKRSGSYAFHLTFPAFADGDQGFEINREIIPSAGSQLLFHDLFRWSATGSRLSAEVSEDSGSTWSEVWARNGNGSTSSSGWDASFNTRSVSLASYAGKAVRIRFVYRFSGSTFLGTDTDRGVFLDGISVSDALQLTGTSVTTLPAVNSNFVLNSATAGEALTAGASYYARIRPNVGTRWFGDGPLKMVTIAQTPHEIWQQENFTTVDVSTGRTGPEADFDGDGLSNFLEYAFGTNPKSMDSMAATLQSHAPRLAISFPCDASRTDIVYAIEASETLESVSWTPIARSIGGATFSSIGTRSLVSDAGTGRRIVTVTDAEAPPEARRRFLRVKVSSL